MTEVVTLAEKLAQKRAELRKQGKLKIADKDAPPPTMPEPAPDVTFLESKRNTELDAIVDGIDIITAYNKWSGKGIVDPGSRTEGIKVRCPNPAHPDNHPSAWINTDKQVWACGACEMGGDKFDIAAWHFGMPVPGYKSGKNFPELRTRMAASMGYIVKRENGVTTVEKPVATGPDGATIELGPPAPPEELAEVVELRPRLDVIEDIELDWRPLCPPGTFLDTYMKQTVVDDVPEEYHLWNGLLAISVAIGRDATLADTRPVYGNLFICILGQTGSGKSKSKYLLDTLLHMALPYSPTDPWNKGVLRTNAPASAEALIWTFQKRIVDPSKPKGSPEELYPVRGIIDYSELSSLVGRGNRSGSVLVPTLMQFYDAESTVSTVSRTHGVEVAHEPYACAITTSQPKSLKGLLTISDATSGFLNRWFFVIGKEKKRVAVGGVTPDMTPAVDPLLKIQGWASAVGSLPWSQPAVENFTKFFDEQIYPIMREDETDLLSRLDLLCKKLILLFSANMHHREVRVEAVEQMKHMFPYLLECYGVPGAQVGTTLQEEIRAEILKAIVSYTTRKGKAPSSRDINQLIKWKKFPLDLYTKTLKHMVEIEEIYATQTMAGDGRGRPTTRYTVSDTREASEMAEKLSKTKVEAKA